MDHAKSSLILPNISEDNPVRHLLDNIEAMSDIQHDIWANWMVYLFSVCVENPDGTKTIPADKVRRWERQIATKYIDLSEAEKDSDREQAIRIICWMANLT